MNKIVNSEEEKDDELIETNMQRQFSTLTLSTK